MHFTVVKLHSRFCCCSNRKKTPSSSHEGSIYIGHRFISTNIGTAESNIIKLTTVVRRSQASHQIVTNLRHAKSSWCYQNVSYLFIFSTAESRIPLQPFPGSGWGVIYHNLVVLYLLCLLYFQRVTLLILFCNQFSKEILQVHHSVFQC